MKLKRIMAFLLSVVLLLSVVPLGGLTVSALRSGNYYYIVSNGEAEITDVKTTISGSVTIPAALGGYPVTSIGNRAFSDCKSITSITVGNKIEKISSYAFYNCTGIKKITVGKNVKTIGEAAFQGCNRVTEITIPFIGASRTSKDSKSAVLGYIFGYTSVSTSGTVLQYYEIYSNSYYKYYYYYIPSALKKVTVTDTTHVPRHAFYNCEKLTSIKLPDGVKSIGYAAFSNCGSLTGIAIPKNVKTIDDFAFEYCIGLEGITIPTSVTSLGEYAFYNCTGISSLTIPKNVKEIGEYAFSSCLGLVDLNIQNGVEKIGVAAFYDCVNVKNLTIPESVTVIDDWTFYRCSQLTQVTVPDSVEKIGSLVFGDCYNLKTVTIPYSVKSMGYGVFIDCPNLESVIIYNPDCTFDLECGITDKHIVYGVEGSAVETFANKVGAFFADIELVHNHNWRAASCTKPKTCKLCGQTVGNKLGHSYKSAVVKATQTKNGKSFKDCSRCGYVASNTTKTIRRINSVKLSATTYTYNGKVKTPTVTVKDTAGKKLVKNTDYTVKYATGRKNVGKHKVTVTFKGKYKGTKTLSFTIKPVKTTVSKLTAGKKSLKVNITKKSTQVTGYQVQYSTSKTFKSAKTKTISSYKTTSTTLSKLSAKKTYYIRVRTYKTVNGTKYYSGWSAYKYKKTK